LIVLVDKFSKKKRSYIMSRIRGKGTKIEKQVMKALRKKGIKFKSHYRIGPGTTSIDIAFPDKKIAVFIDGDFWHGYNWLRLRKNLPKFWRAKLKRNIVRDKKVTARLKEEGWQVFRFWEHSLKKNMSRCIDMLWEKNLSF